LVFLGEDLWRDLLGLVAASAPSCAVEAMVPAEEVGEDYPEETAELDEVTGRAYESLDLSEDRCEDLEMPGWPEGWDEEKIWGDISPSKRRSLKRLLGSGAPKWMDT
jgi:hypothetical protein